MRSLLYLMAGLGFLGLGFWAYQENYATQTSLREVRDLNNRIGAAHARLNMLEAEWAYLNRPDRLRELVNLNYTRLMLVPMMPESFDLLARVPMAPEDYVPLLDATQVSSDMAPPEGEEPL
ncbi:MAG: cell division protein FtsL [Rubellimicrobium sp.]|nr:cell division protein FtsL [Rubellimicrobium sp.]